MPSRRVESHPKNPSLFVSCTDRLNLFEIGDLFTETNEDAGKHAVSSCYIEDLPWLSHRRATLKGSRPLAGLTCLDWCKDESKPCVLGFGNNKGDVFVLNWDRNTETKISAPETTKRQCNDVVWCDVSGSNRLAVGYEKTRGEMAVVVYDIAPYDINFQSPRATALPPFSETAASLCWLPHSPDLIAVGTISGWIRVHDTRSGSSAEMNILAHTEPKSRRIKGVKFDPFNERIFATFSDVANEPVKIWDLRKVEKSKDPRVLTIDPFQGGLVHSSKFDFSGGNESKSGSTIGGSEGVIDIEWSTTRCDVLALATSYDSNVHFYSTVKAPNAENVSKTPISSIQVQGGSITSLSWMKRPYTSSGENIRDDADIGVTLKNRLLVGTASGVTDVSVIDSIPLAISNGPINGAAHGAANSVVMFGATKLQLCFQEESADESESIDEIMLSMCKAGYAVDAGKNIQVLSDKLDALSDTLSTSPSERSKIFLQLQRVWCWVDRVESMSIVDTSLTLQNCGVLQLIDADSSKAPPATYINTLDTVPCVIHESIYRKAARSVCGWAMLKVSDPTIGSNELDPHEVRYLELEGLVEEYEKYDTFERACALALWHGNLNLSVDVLKRAMESLEKRSGTNGTMQIPVHRESRASSAAEESLGANHQNLEDEDDDIEDELTLAGLNRVNDEYAKLIPLVAMCLAGFPSDEITKRIQGDKTGKSKDSKPSKISHSRSESLWASMCVHLVSQLRLVHDRPSVAYLIAACEFLLALLLPNYACPHLGDVPQDASRSIRKYACVLFSPTMAVEDRCAFACTYLSNEDMTAYLRSLQMKCLNESDIEGVILMGLGQPQGGTDGQTEGGGGIRLLQKYLDESCDIQTVALLVSRLPQALTSAPTSYYTIEGEWLTCYRTLLNKWRLFMERAKLDVELGKRFRQLSMHNSAKETVARKLSGSSAAKPTDTSKVVYPLPAHLLDEGQSHMCLKCSYCSGALPVDPMDKKHTSSNWLRRQRPVMNCCPNCKKPLPRCYVCLSFTGLLNPQMELKVIAKRREIEHSVVTLLTPPPSAAATSAIQNSTIHEKLSQLDLEEQNVFEQGKWFMWCQRCKHGGHASCLESWFDFKGSRACGVNGCSCACSL